MFEYALVSGLTASGADAFLMHVTKTPSVAYIVRTDEFDCGIMISASHNPFYDNGIKILDNKGHKMNNEVEKKIEDYIDGLIDELPLARKDTIGCASDYSVRRNRYIGYLMFIPTRAFKNIRVGLDCTNGASGAIEKSVFDSLGVTTYVINNDPDGININTNCGSTHIDVLSQFVKEKGLDIGFAYDGDADRCIVVDEFGRDVNGDLILYVCDKYLKDHYELSNNTIVTSIMSNLGLYKALDKANIDYVKTALGDKYVNENMVENNHCLGGEESGHIIFSKHATTGDGILTSLRIMEAIIESKQTLAQLTEPVTIYPQLTKNVRVENKKAAREDEAVVKAIKEVEELLREEGRVIVIESGTELVIRVMVEASTDELCNQYVNHIVSVMTERGLVL